MAYFALQLRCGLGLHIAEAVARDIPDVPDILDYGVVADVAVVCVPLVVVVCT